MAALAADRTTRMRSGGATRVNKGDVAASTKIYKGAVIAKNAAGYIVPAADTAALKVVGVAEEQVDNTAGANGAKTVSYITGADFELVNLAGAIVQASKHALCYAGDDQSVSTAALMTNDLPVGTVSEFTTTKVWVYIDERANA
jgi:hypothetical protein